jgi:hypothetical protein
MCKHKDDKINILLHALLIYSEGEIRTVEDAKQFLKDYEYEGIKH